MAGDCIICNVFLHFLFFEHRPRWSTNGTQRNFAAGLEVSQTSLYCWC